MSSNSILLLFHIRYIRDIRGNEGQSSEAENSVPVAKLILLFNTRLWLFQYSRNENILTGLSHFNRQMPFLQSKTLKCMGIAFRFNKSR